MNQFTYSIDMPTRAIAPVAGLSENRFYVGTCEAMSPSADTNNSLFILDYTEGTTLDSVQAWNIDGEVWRLCPCPSSTQPDLLCAILSPRDAPADRRGTFFRATPGNPELLTVEVLAPSLGRIADVLWDSDGLADRAVCVSSTGVHILKVSSTVSVARTVPLPPALSDPTVPGSAAAAAADAGLAPVAAAWDPHHSEAVAVAAGRDIAITDLRSARGGASAHNAHIGGVSCVAYDPLALYRIVTGGLDSALRLWDPRNLSAPLLSIDDAHTHWVTSVAANAHSATPDSSLFITASTDGTCKVWSATPSARNPLLHATAGGESVYSACWGSGSAWTFGSAAFDGRITVERLPRALVDGVLLKARNGGAA